MIGPYDTSWYSGPTGRFVLNYGAITDFDEGQLLPYAYCVEIQTIQGNVLYNIVDVANVPAPYGPSDPGNGGPMGVSKADYVRELWARFENQVNSNITGAAFALAMYEIVFEDSTAGWDVTDGLFKADYAYYAAGSQQQQAMDLANDWLAQITGTGPKANLVGLTHNNRQDLVVGYIIPAPGAIFLAGIGTGLVGWMKRRRSL